MALGLNTALINWSLQSINLEILSKTMDNLNPLLMDEKTRPLQKRIESLQKEIDSLRQSKLQ